MDNINLYTGDPNSVPKSRFFEEKINILVGVPKNKLSTLRILLETYTSGRSDIPNELVNIWKEVLKSLPKE